MVKLKTIVIILNVVIIQWALRRKLTYSELTAIIASICVCAPC